MTSLPERVIDACVHHHWRSQVEITNLMSDGWREHIGIPGSLPGGAGAMPLLPGRPWRHPRGDYLPGSSPENAPSGSDPAQTIQQALQPPVERAILSHDRGMLIPGVPNTYRASAVVSAINDWTLGEWVAKDDRMHALALVPNQTPDDAAAEIRRIGENDRIIGVLMAANGLSRPFGHPAYHTIYRAAAEMALPIVFHVGGDTISDTLSHPTAGGLPSTFAEISSLSFSSILTHVQSMIVQGVFEKFPGLRLFVSGAGTAWMPGLFFRLDVNWRGLRREVPWVRRRPSEYFRENVRVSTWPLDRPAAPDGAARLVRLLEAFGGAEDLLCFASGYPYWNADTVADVAARLPDTWHSKVFHDNAASWFRWPGTERQPMAESQIIVGDMPGTGAGSAPPVQRRYEAEDGRELEWVSADD